MKDKKYYLTRKQLGTIYHYTLMFKQNADTINELYIKEEPDVTYAFHFGRMHAHLMDCYMAMVELHDSIETQKIKE